ncbi:MAG: hypothetical protein KA477_01035 [Candidatus Levybacteria bacterium]|nr:hypothetical protein [Candidatus Levybacteria bacterium]
MPYGIESRSTTRGTQIEIETIPGPHTTGVNAHWGERIPRNDLVERIKIAYPNIPLQNSTGFDVIWHQADGTSREQGIQDELEVGKLLIETVIKSNGWKPEEVAGLFIGSGVPIADDPRYQDYARTLGGMVGMRQDAHFDNMYAACASGGHQLINALTREDMQGEKVVVAGLEGISFLTENFDPKLADSLSMEFFGNGAAAKGIIPGRTMTVLSQAHRVVRDEDEVLAAHMTYKDMMDPNGETLQSHGNTRMIVMPTPKDGMRITMEGPSTGLFFIRNTLGLVEELYKEHLERWGHFPIDFSSQHHPSETVFNNFQKRAKRLGISVPTPWVVNDGNSSAATSLIAHNRIVGELARPGNVELFVAYGAGGSFDGGVILHAGKPQTL